MNRFHKKLIIGLVLLIIIVFVLYYFGLSRYLSLTNIKANAVFLKSKVTENYFRAVLSFIGISTALIAFTLPITAPMGVIGGFLFGIWAAVLYCIIAIIVGAAISFLVMRYALYHFMQHRYGKRLASFNTRMKTYGYAYLITLQLLTIVPYFIINTLAALAGVPFATFLATTVIGSLPVLVIYAFAGRQLYKIHAWRDILSKEMLLLLVLLAGVALLPLIVRKWRSRYRQEDDEDTF